MDCGESLRASGMHNAGAPRQGAQEAIEALLDVGRNARIEGESRPEDGRKRAFAAGWQQGVNLLNIHACRRERQKASGVSVA
jgi:hypothetical protein